MVRRVLGALNWAGQTYLKKVLGRTTLDFYQLQTSHAGDRIDFKF